MPSTPWEEVVGYLCDQCKENPATHIYGTIYRCCYCHAGPGQGISPEEALALHLTAAVGVWRNPTPENRETRQTVLYMLASFYKACGAPVPDADAVAQKVMAAIEGAKTAEDEYRNLYA